MEEAAQDGAFEEETSGKEETLDEEGIMEEEPVEDEADETAWSE